MAARIKRTARTDWSIARRLMRKAIALLAPPKPESILEWAERERVITESAIKGEFRALPYQRFPLAQLSNRRWTQHVWLWAAQTGKTEGINSVVLYHIAGKPCGQMVVYPTVETAEIWSKKKLAKAIAACAVVRDRIRNSRTRDSGNTIRSKEYPGGDLVVSGANSPSTLRSSSRAVVIQDEIDTYPPSAGNEGDPCELADVRAATYSDALLIKSSTPTLKGSSRIEGYYMRSSQHRLHVPCPHCGEWQTLKWAQVKMTDVDPKTARYCCEKCGEDWTDEQRIRAITTACKDDAGWRADNPTADSLGTHISGLYQIIGLKKGYLSLPHQWCSDFLNSKAKGPEGMKVWINTFLAETYEEGGVRVDEVMLESRAEEYLERELLPASVLLLTGAVDVQNDRLECEIVGWGADEERWGLRVHVIYGDPRGDEVWARLDEHLASGWKHPCGKILFPVRVFIDCGYAQDRVLAYTAARYTRGIFACKGINRVGLNIPPLLPTKPSRNNKTRTPFWPVGVTVAKAAIYGRLPMEPGGPRSMHFPKRNLGNGQYENFGYSREYFKQLSSEKAMTRYSFGQPYVIYEKDKPGDRNEAIDLAVYGLAALHSLMPIAWDKLARRMGADKKQAGELTEEAMGEVDAADKPAETPPPREIDAPRLTPEMQAAKQAQDKKQAGGIRRRLARGGGGWMSGYR